MLQQDFDLSREDVQLLSSRDALTAFFAKLGYDTNVRLTQNVNAMGITGETLRTSIKHIERLANREALGLLLEVYLFELTSVTVAATQAIARSFRDRPGDYLLVLTGDYQELDFVLVQRYIPAKQQETPGPGVLPAKPQGVSVLPRILTVNRRDPDMVALRVLRRFSYTEQYPFQQYDKLLSAYEVAEWSEPFFNNRALFSDYYLLNRLPERSEWKASAEVAAMTQAFKTLRTLYADARDEFSGKPEQVARTQLLEPAFTALGFTAQTVKADQNGEIVPDYRLYATSNATQTTPNAVCLAYAWGRNLDGRDDARDVQAPDENPGAAVVTLLDEGEAEWAIVTNGKIWRLYSAKAHSRATNYYEIDLEETLVVPEAHLEEAFRYFWLLFRATAFAPATESEEGQQRCFLDSLLDESERYARELGERLKERVFEQIFPHFARGFIQYARRNGQLPELDTLADEERSRALEPFFSGTLTFLYRLLFLLYAESRDLLPVRELHGYHPKSLEKLKDEIKRKAGDIEDTAPGKLKAAYSELSTALYDRLQALFHAVDKGDASLNVPVYNGGLFVTQPDPDDSSPEASVARFLATHKIPDRQLALGLDLMARDEDKKTHALALIDYKSLGVRQLGSIYEGLLEFKLRIAPEEVVVVKGKKTEEVVPYAEARQKKLTIVKEGRGKEASDKTYSKGYVYLENDRRERKATGSYYTPDYIVKYIVEHTVGPVLQEKLEALRPLFREAEQTLRTKRDKHEALKKQRLLTSGDDPERETYNHYRETLNEAFFDLKVLDPAMGSGHFLVEAVDYITDQMAKFITAFKWNPVVYGLAETRREIQQEMERQGVTVDMSKLTDLNLLKRQVLKRCIYGVDLNPMAVELAKVSLWLDCFTLGAPLSFLDHHMKPGNSLIGGNVQEVQDALSQNLWGSQFSYLLDATQLMRRVGELSDVTAQEVAESRKAYKGAYDALAPFKRLLDIWLSEYFGNKKARITTSVYAGAIVANNYSKANEADKKAIETALVLATAKQFFHWELEFPEVFYDAKERKKNGGFDAVVGNPPYDVMEKEEFESRTNDLEQLVHYLEQVPLFSAAFGGKINIFRFFIVLYHAITKQEGLHGYIVPIGLITDRGCFGLRQLLLQQEKILKVNLFPERYSPERRVFQDAKVSPCIVIAQNTGTTDSFTLVIHDGKYLENVSSSQQVKADEIKTIDPETLAFPQVPEPIWYIATKIHEPNTSAYLKDVAVVGGGEIHLTYYKVCFTTDKIMRPMYRGAEIGRYLINEELSQGEKLYLDVEKCNSRKLAVKEFPQRIALQRITGVEDKRRLLGVLIEPSISLAHTVQFIMSSSAISTAYLTAIFNSTLLDLRFRVTSGTSNVGVYELEYLPIRRINFITPDKERACYLEKAKGLYEQCLSKDDRQCVLGFVEDHLSREPGGSEESDVVHDLLAFLAEEMIRLNREKRAATREFLDWLVTALRILPDKDGRKGIDALTGKSKLADYAGDYQKGEPALTFDEVRDILLKNRTRLGVNLSDTALVDRLRKEYDESLQRVLPLKDKLAKTDALIDRVVYRLYGLTEEEVKVVEGRG